jgi:predicted GNAT family N-acyltransferase
MKIEIRTPKTQEEWEAYYLVRYNELRKPWGQPPGSEKDDKEHLGTHHALFVDNQLVGVLRVDETETKGVVQFRFMAISNAFQGNKLGEQLMTYAEKLVRESGNQQVILHAREVALKFYEKLGYSTVKKSHLLYDAIQHYLMKKDISA